MQFKPIAKIAEMYADIRNVISALYHNRPDDERKLEREVDQTLEWLMANYGSILADFISVTRREVQEGGRLYGFGKSEYWPVFKELLDDMISQAAADNLNLYVTREIQNKNAALAMAAMTIQAAIDGHLDEYDLKKFMLEKCQEGVDRLRIKQNMKTR